MEQSKRRILLIDQDDSRRRTRVRLLTSYGYSVEVRDDYVSAERLNNEGDFDLVTVALHNHPEEAAAYSDHLSVKKPLLPILLLTDYGVYVPPGTLSPSIESGNPAALIGELFAILDGTAHIRELPIQFH
jgi:hypothetical protein